MQSRRPYHGTGDALYIDSVHRDSQGCHELNGVALTLAARANVQDAKPSHGELAKLGEGDFGVAPQDERSNMRRWIRPSTGTIRCEC